MVAVNLRWKMIFVVVLVLFLNNASTEDIILNKKTFIENKLSKYLTKRLKHDTVGGSSVLCVDKKA